MPETEHNVYSLEVWFNHNLDAYSKQLDTVMSHIQMLKNEIQTLEAMKLEITLKMNEK